MKSHPLYFLLACMMLCGRLTCQKGERKDYFKFGIVVNQVRPVSGDIRFNFTDPGSGVAIHKSLGAGAYLNQYGIDIGFIEVVRPKGLIINPFNFSLLANGKSAWLDVGTGAGYEVALFRAHVKTPAGMQPEPVLKFRAGVQLGYGFYEYYLSNNVQSPNGHVISVEGTPITSEINIDVLKKCWKLSPSLGFNCRLSHHSGLRLYAIYNYVFAGSEQAYFYETRLYYSKYHYTRGVKTGEQAYLTDANGNGLKHVFTLTPLIFKIEYAFYLD